MKFLLLVAFFSFCTKSIAQSECWECIVAANNLERADALKICTAVSKGLLNKNEKEITSVVLGRLLLDNGKPKEAIPYLEVAMNSEDSLLFTVSNGLLGDCYFETDNFEQALSYYSKASNRVKNSLFTPYFLHKQGLVFLFMKNYEGMKNIGSKIRMNYSSYFWSKDLVKLYGTEPTIYDSINRQLTDNRLPDGPYGIGLINGQPANEKTFSEFLGQIQSEINERESYSDDKTQSEFIDDMAWERMVYQSTVQSKNKAFCLSVNDKEFHAYLFGDAGYPLLIDIKSNFTDENGKFDRKAFQLFLDEKNNETNDRIAKETWDKTMRDMKRALSGEKYTFLLRRGLYYTEKEFEIYERFHRENITVESILLYPDRSRSGSNIQIKPGENQIKDYFSKHKMDVSVSYPAERTLRYFTIPVSSTKKDTLKFLKELEALKVDFKNSKQDSLFVMTHSDVKFYSSSHQMTFQPVSDRSAMLNHTYPNEMAETMKKAQIGDVIGPYLDNDQYKLVKVIGFNENLLTARHILIGCPKGASKEEYDSKKKFAYNLSKQINHENFTDFVRKYSEDGGSVEKGGVYTDFLDYQMVEPFATFAVNSKIGQIGVVETDFGFHIMEVLSRKKVKYPVLAVVQKELKATDALKEDVEKEVNQLYKKMNAELQNIPDKFEREDYFESQGDYTRSMIINERNPVASGLESEFSQKELIKAIYDSNIQPYTLLKPVLNGDNWIIPFYQNSYSGDLYNYEQVHDLMKFNCARELLMDSLTKSYHQLTSLKEVSKASNQEPSVITLYRDESKVNDRWIPDFTYSIFSDKIELNTLHWYSSNSTVIAYQIINSSKDDSIRPDSKSREELQKELIENSSYIMNVVDPLDPKTVFNYQLYKLGLRQ